MIPSSRRSLAALTAVVLSLSLGACAITLGDSGQSSGADQASVPADTGQSAPVSTLETPAAEMQAPQSASTAASAAPQQGTAAAGGAGSAQPGAEGSAGAAPASGDRPGAAARITDSDWLSFEGSVDKTVRSTGAVLLDKEYDDVRIDGDVATLTITADSVEVVADYIDTLVIKGAYVDVYVRDVNRVIIHGDSNEVIWAGNTPIVEDFGSYNDTGLQGTRG
ncbi:DUF3060 domain-containing protein [Actinomyces bowdenii]|uniref:DUF3060 domain-containing protein n=1 Tax=Actinomyces bowdenii TaxID=131109 RepID=A0A853EJY8_9ACTO|nr:DUF3060 domain-containing protein [Actinomyces bowdenii]MBF0697494.1 DUF3060 domain-containing protein [Actinomyces bowdenii]NYS69667.1 DUF3060 domain-containing protein [Actinomyces bowdenii]